ncbi:MAG: RNA repair transcriptional activator RtcR [Rhodopirellula sp. JB044]|uniref:RNA repair transcriptional activator RtcR n=1 Tax=Rhodopirellula sp. JB044 TaxID=3342844 RepID=UPI00370BC0BC
MKTVVIGLLGVQLDQPRKSRDRWNHWRPSVAVCQQDDLIVDRFDLLVERRYSKLAEQVIGDITTVSPETRVQRHNISLNDPWDFEEVYATLHGFCRKYPFEPEHERYLVHITTGTHVAQICLFLLTESRHFPARLLQSSPPTTQRQTGRNSPKSDERLSVGTYQIVDLDLSRYDDLAKRFKQEHDEAASILKSGIQTKDPAFNAMIDRIERVSLATKAPILMTGPTGAGKTRLAKRIYELKRNRRQVDGPFVEVNCATIRGDQAMSTLFGHTKGAFTGANQARAGLLKTADTGMLFLDEIGELGMDEQAMLLRAIEDKTFMPVGSDRPTCSDFQLIAGSNRDLLADVAGGKFREDLLSRINLWTFRLPGLSERRSDIDPNIDFELHQYAISTGDKVTFNQDARKAFLRFATDPSTAWQANFRDLNAAITRMATLSDNGRITNNLVSEEIIRLRAGWTSTNPNEPSHTLLKECLDDVAIEQIDRFDRAQLSEVIRVCRTHKSLSAAGRELFQASRLLKTRANDADRLRKYLARFGLQWEDVQQSN